MTRLNKHDEIDEDSVCSHCGEVVEPNWVACPHCGKKLGRNMCPSCSGPVKPEWAACPACGARLSRHHHPAREPSSVTEEEAFEWLVHDDHGPSMDSDWLFCPSCGRSTRPSPCNGEVPLQLSTAAGSCTTLEELAACVDKNAPVYVDESGNVLDRLDCTTKEERDPHCPKGTAGSRVDVNGVIHETGRVTQRLQPPLVLRPRTLFFGEHNAAVRGIHFPSPDISSCVVRSNATPVSRIIDWIRFDGWIDVWDSYDLGNRTLYRLAEPDTYHAVLIPLFVVSQPISLDMAKDVCDLLALMTGNWRTNNIIALCSCEKPDMIRFFHSSSDPSEVVEIPLVVDNQRNDMTGRPSACPARRGKHE